MGEGAGAVCMQIWISIRIRW